MSHLLNQPLPDATLVACPNCDLVQRLSEIAPGESARCPRCETELWRRKENSLHRTLALTLAALILWVIANTMPMLGLSAAGIKSFTTLFHGAKLLWLHGQEPVALIIFFTAIVAPALQIGFMLLLLAGSMRERPPVWVGQLVRQIPFTRIWSMVEVLLVGVMVSLTKIAEYATVIPGYALFSVGALVVVLVAMQVSFDAREIWRRVEWEHAKEQAETAGKQLMEAAR